MSLPELIRRSAEKQLADFCREQNAAGRVDAGRLEWVRGDSHLTLVVDQAAPGGPVRRPVARFRYSAELGQWTLHHRDRQGRWVFYLNAGASLDFGRLLRALAADPFHFFWPD